MTGDNQLITMIASAAPGIRGIAAMGLLSASLLVGMLSEAELRRVGRRDYPSPHARSWRRWVVAVSLSVFAFAVVVQIVRLLP